jgi:hypothetical protein
VTQPDQISMTDPKAISDAGAAFRKLSQDLTDAWKTVAHDIEYLEGRLRTEFTLDTLTQAFLPGYEARAEPARLAPDAVAFELSSIGYDLADSAQNYQDTDAAAASGFPR